MTSAYAESVPTQVEVDAPDDGFDSAKEVDMGGPTPVSDHLVGVDALNGQGVWPFVGDVVCSYDEGQVVDFRTTDQSQLYSASRTLLELESVVASSGQKDLGKPVR